MKQLNINGVNFELTEETFKQLEEMKKIEEKIEKNYEHINFIHQEEKMCEWDLLDGEYYKEIFKLKQERNKILRKLGLKPNF